MIVGGRLPNTPVVSPGVTPSQRHAVVTDAQRGMVSPLPGHAAVWASTAPCSEESISAALQWGSLPSLDRQPWHRLEVAIPAHHRQIVLPGQRCDPHIIFRKWGTSATKDCLDLPIGHRRSRIAGQERGSSGMSMVHRWGCHRICDRNDHWRGLQPWRRPYRCRRWCGGCRDSQQAAEAQRSP